MSSWFDLANNQKCKGSPQVNPSTRVFLYDASVAVNNTALTLADLLGASQVVIAEAVPQPPAVGVLVPNTPVYLPSHVGLLSMFKRPKLDDTFSIIFANETSNSIVLTVDNPLRTALILQGQVAQVFFRVINPIAIPGTADVKLQEVSIGATSSVLCPQQVLNLSGTPPTLVITTWSGTISPQNLWQNRPLQINVTNSDGLYTAGATVAGGTAPKLVWSQTPATYGSPPAATGWVSGFHNLLLAPGTDMVGRAVVGPLHPLWKPRGTIIISNNLLCPLVIELGMPDTAGAATVLFPDVKNVPAAQQNQTTAIYGTNNFVINTLQTFQLDYIFTIAGTEATNWVGSTVRFIVQRVDIAYMPP